MVFLTLAVPGMWSLWSWRKEALALERKSLEMFSSFYHQFIFVTSCITWCFIKSCCSLCSLKYIWKKLKFEEMKEFRSHNGVKMGGFALQWNLSCHHPSTSIGHLGILCPVCKHSNCPRRKTAPSAALCFCFCRKCCIMAEIFWDFLESSPLAKLLSMGWDLDCSLVPNMQVCHIGNSHRME